MAEFILDADFNVLDDPDMDLGKTDYKTVDLVATYVVDVPEITEEYVIAEYPNGGRDVGTRVVQEGSGHWQYERDGALWEDCPAEPAEWWSKNAPNMTQLYYQLYTPYTAEELAEKQAEREKIEAEQAEREAAKEMQAALPDAVAELSELASDNATSVEDLANAIAELSQLVSDMLEE